jgi:dihydrofolate reductase
MFAEISKECGVVMMGEKTFATFPAPLKDRLNVVFAQDITNKPELPGVKWVTGEPAKVLDELAASGYTSALLGGGSFLNTMFLEKKLIDELIITVEPKIFGQGMGLFNGDFNLNLQLMDMKKINDNSIVLKYKAIY